MRIKYGVKEEWCLPYKPQKIIKTDEYGDLTAVNLLDEITNGSKATAKQLAQAKDIVYKKMFNQGTMLAGPAKGETVEAAKHKTRQYLEEQGLALSYWEPDGRVVSKLGDECIVASCQQWFIKYGESEWR